MNYSTFSIIQLISTAVVIGIEVYAIIYCYNIIHSADSIYPEKYPLVYLYFSMIGAIFLNIPSLLTGILQSKIASIFAIIFDIIAIVLLFIVYIIGQIFQLGVSSVSEQDKITEIEKEANCCGWKTLKIEGCQAKDISKAVPCYKIVGEPFLESVNFAIEIDGFAMKAIVLLICVTLVFIIFHRNQSKVKQA
ncbi:hypothetical protein EHI8A_221690 [Entamoeba histolytica HM-1:IMSS-B]|uniref:Tetraspanin family protein n=6 Tax=Entamoeba histolytica TaxID=5759 RepID=C4M1X7_ENTH1|nr:hypothetical protein EHI_164840 [Entamoeba histolytica HM-1:IMSS]EMD48351.1 Hypothetical protein EHI5A_170700 [Entamoeba histolytica KU27]EMH77305.1 hypothetical protein EHI8A_221690 [Entamoeba histolytica HM-1:IMSS-B]EMS17512.1 hypothetical protein KM1_256160 [Entamoeba histolytica HM-3:IMSS]ENY63067.1 hypothetical protein EHI7A_165220 [Entamoeba histolytica HM-1:IMSS-A]GAT95249.1 hypothetical protein CL6EHI_164840 [Entamoeba histolytica]|eukprot:XP_655214.1 hypothetical protein EHI_164840 [Entamoeba histolytica HM-1:IMSS]